MNVDELKTLAKKVDKLILSVIYERGYDCLDAPCPEDDEYRRPARYLKLSKKETRKVSRLVLRGLTDEERQSVPEDWLGNRYQTLFKIAYALHPQKVDCTMLSAVEKSYTVVEGWQRKFCTNLCDALEYRELCKQCDRISFVHSIEQMLNQLQNKKFMSKLNLEEEGFDPVELAKFVGACENFAAALNQIHKE